MTEPVLHISFLPKCVRQATLSEPALRAGVFQLSPPAVAAMAARGGCGAVVTTCLTNFVQLGFCPADERWARSSRSAGSRQRQGAARSLLHQRSHEDLQGDARDGERPGGDR